ncbi:hypothetical protein UFOVP674_2 [uncultured Caudovirales phage]|jgi:hypothetical protein|uniref:Uncharacterized protein n=1 Tax=uncultured Caudovirales phage TaxID=2100421 RepID=A0A6J5NBE7_9CAUD|nr:hypothetical protein UFOVP674_2 [uncultured Caudovirales phage]
MKEQIEKLKAELREFIELSKTITLGKWENASRSETSDIIGKDDICGGVYVASVSRIAWGAMYSERGDANATFIAHSRNISPAMAECLLVAVEGLEIVAFIEEWQAKANSYSTNRDLSFNGRNAWEKLDQIINLWNLK